MQLVSVRREVDANSLLFVTDEIIFKKCIELSFLRYYIEININKLFWSLP